MKHVCLFLLAAVTSTVALTGCTNTGCLNGQPNCKIPTPCAKVAFQCSAATASALAVKRIERANERPGGSAALGTVGDVLLSNQFAQVVIADIGHRHYLDPNGGSILDLAVPGVPNDGVNNILQVVGILPRDSAHYESLEIIDERPDRVAVQVIGTLDGQPKTRIATRYELQACDKGVRVRTEVLNGGSDAQLWALMDGYYWSKREPVPFAPGLNGGYHYEPFGLTTINDVFRSMPYMAASSHNGERASFSVSSCSDDHLEGFNSDTVSAVGMPRKVIQPRGLQIYERFIGIADGKSPAAAGDIALEVRKQLWKENLATVKGKIERPGALRLDSERETSVLISEGKLSDSEDKRSPWVQTVVSTTGQFEVRVPSGKNYVVEVHSFGKKQIEKEFNVGGDTDFGTFTLPSTGVVTVNAKDGNSMNAIDAMVFVVPADDATKTNTEGSFHGVYGKCAPWLGSPPGASPACNRILTFGGTATVEVPAGKYHFYGFHGPFWTLDRKTIDVAAGMTTTVDLKLTRTSLQPSNALSADLHVHGAASFDSSIPDNDRVQSFLASDMDVIVATDHDVVYDYADAQQKLGTTNRLSVVSGVETTGHIPWLHIPNYPYPLVVGHYNFWPLKYDPLLPKNGGPEDELIEPGQIFTNALEFEPSTLPKGTQLKELNHPWAAAEFGRDLGFPRAIFMDLRKDLPTSDDGTNMGLYVRKPDGASFTNDGHDAQEVMNGSQNDTLLQYRAFWFYTLNQGLLKTGTANSDSHSLVDNIIGMPRNLIEAGTVAGPAFDITKFNAAIRAGKVLGTNGPVIEATVEADAGGPQSWSMTPFKPKAGARVKVKVSSAPWIPVKEIRFVVNGEVVKTVAATSVAAADPFGAAELVRYDGDVSLDELLTGVSGDAWLVIEAGNPLSLVGDLGGGLDDAPDGMPDTTDNNGDGKVDSADIEGDGAKFGPLKNPTLPAEGAVDYHYAAITEGFPFAYTNPFLLDRNGDGAFNAPGVKGGR
jgi:hypothetical protein